MTTHIIDKTLTSSSRQARKRKGSFWLGLIEGDGAISWSVKYQNEIRDRAQGTPFVTLTLEWSLRSQWAFPPKWSNGHQGPGGSDWGEGVTRHLWFNETAHVSSEASAVGNRVRDERSLSFNHLTTLAFCAPSLRLSSAGRMTGNQEIISTCTSKPRHAYKSHINTCSK